MANYPSSLTGAQLNDALQQVEARIPEGWAVGTYNGVPVASGSPYYNNNAKYYAAIAQAAIPSNTEGAVFFSKAQTLTASQQSQARANIMAGGSNPNLLDNWWWGTGVINQRDFSSGNFAHKVYKIDRWFTSYSESTAGTVSLSDDGITLDMTASSSSYNVFCQLLSTPHSFLAGREITASALMSDGTIISGTAVAPVSASGNISVLINSTYGLRLQYGGNVGFRVRCDKGKTFTIKAVKLELGTVSTLANDAPPNYAEELAKCQRYFIRLYHALNQPIGLGFAHSATSLRVQLPLPVSMRSWPSSSYTGSFYIRGNGIENTTITSIGVGSQTIAPINQVNLLVNCSGLTLYQIYALARSTEGYIDLSADL